MASIALKQIKGKDTAFEQDIIYHIYCTCKIQQYTIAMLLLILLCIIFIATTKVRKLTFLEGICSLI